MDKPKIISGVGKPRVVGVESPIQNQGQEVQNNQSQRETIENQAIKDIIQVKGKNAGDPFQINDNLKQRIEEDQKKRKPGLIDRIKTILKI